jgi:hypothetical protein
MPLLPGYGLACEGFWPGFYQPEAPSVYLVAYRKLSRPTYPWGMSKLRRADYTQHLAGKTVLRITWHNEPDEAYRCLSIFFTDDTMVSFRFHTFVDEEAELADFIGGNLSGERLITPAPITRPAKDGE